MKTIYIPLLLLLALMTSCSYDFELKGMDAAEKLVLYCMPDADSDTTLIQLYRSQPVTRQKKKGKKTYPMPASHSASMVRNRMFVTQKRMNRRYLPDAIMWLGGGARPMSSVSVQKQTDCRPYIQRQPSRQASY